MSEPDTERRQDRRGVSQEVCWERHIAVKDNQHRQEDDVKQLWSAVGEIRNTVSGLSNRIAYTVGGITMFINIVFLLLQIFLPGHKAP